MKHSIERAPEHVGETITLTGRIHFVRDQKTMQFLIIEQGNFSIQAIVFKKQQPELATITAHWLAYSWVEITGLIVNSSQSKTRGVEMQISSAVLLGGAEPMPIQPESALEARFAERAVDLKFTRQQQIFKLRSAWLQGIREYLIEKAFLEIQTPKLMGTPSESGAGVFEVKYFQDKAYLAQSPQFYKQMAVASGLERVFEIGPVFRAEASYSSRHLTEFTGLDLEIGGIQTVEEIMDLEESILFHAWGTLAKYSAAMETHFSQTYRSLTSTRIQLSAAKELLSRETGHKFRSFDDLTDEDEKQLYKILGHDLIFVYGYPIHVRPFYHRWDEASQTTHSFDLLFRGLEITTGAVREHCHATLLEQMSKKGLTGVGLEGYLSCFKYGCPPHGGLGLGVERFVAQMLGLTSTKEASMFPRDPGRLFP